MNIPNLEETTEIVSKWISTCENQKQLNLCKDLIDNFVVNRFKNHAAPVDLAVYQNRLDTLWAQKKEQLGYRVIENLD